MSQILLRRVSAYSHVVVRGHGGFRGLSSAAHGAGGDRRRVAAPQDDEGRAVRVSVWWDFENCQLPNGVNALRVAPRVAAALRSEGIRGPLSITAFGDVLQLARASQEALAATGVSICHVPRCGKNSADRSFMADLINWISQNPPPVHFFLISGDTDFANILHRLRMSNYNVLLACPSSATNALCSAATIMWPWEALVKGVDFSPKRFNHPPDGFHGSWYGQCEGVLDDPFLEMEREESIKVPSASQDCSVSSVTSHSSIPKYVTNAIMKALCSYPEGVNLSDLRENLRKNNIFLGNDFFGHKKFSVLLRSMPDIVEFLNPPPGENIPYVIAVNKRSRLHGDKSSKTLRSDQCTVRENDQCTVRENDLAQTALNVKTHPSSVSTNLSERNSKLISSTKNVNEKPPTFAVSSSPSDLLSEDRKEYPAADVSAETELPAKQKEVDERTISGSSSSSGVGDAVNKGLFKRIWILWNGSENTKNEVSQSSESTSAEVVDDFQTPLQEHNDDRRMKLLRRIHKTSSRNGCSDGVESTGTVSAELFVSSDNDHSEKINSSPSILENSKPCTGPASVSMSEAGEKDDTSEMGKGLFSWASRWWAFRKSDADSSTTNRQVNDKAKTVSIEESESSNGSTSRPGEQISNEIFTKPHLWAILEQQLSKPLGSELVLKAKTREELAHALTKLGCWPVKSLLEKDLHHLVNLLISEKKWIEETSSKLFPFRLTLPHKRTCVPSSSSKNSGLSSIFSNRKLPQGKSVDGNNRKSKPLTREEILSDCQKLLKELLSQYEYGFNISIFKLRFAQKHGYTLDHQKLGYPDLESLLQIMPGARIKFPRVLPAENRNEEAGSKGNGNRSNGDDLIWEELGPVSGTTESIPAGVDKEMCYHPPSPSDDEFSDNDSQAVQEPRRNAEQSSLLQIIDSWNSSKDDGSSKKPQEIDGLVDCSRSNPVYLDNPGSAERSTRLSKQYSFVSDSEEGKGKDKLVESVLGSLQKARGSKLRN